MIKFDKESFEKKTVLVEFAKENIGSVGLIASDNKLIIQQLVSDKKIGEKITPEDVKELPKIVLDFTKEESVDSLIKCLENVKHFMKYPNGTLHLAC